MLEKDDNVLNLQIWDTAGAEKYHSMGQSFYRNSESCVLVFDLTQPESFQNVEIWRTEFLNALSPSDADTYPFVLLGNKSDMDTSIKVTKDEINDYCSKHNNMPYFETSAKNDVNLSDAFDKVADLAYERNTKNNGDENFIPTKNVQIGKAPEQKKKKCC